MSKFINLNSLNVDDVIELVNDMFVRKSTKDNSKIQRNLFTKSMIHNGAIVLSNDTENHECIIGYTYFTLLTHKSRYRIGLTKNIIKKLIDKNLKNLVYD